MRALAAVLLLAAPLGATDYLTPDQAGRSMYPEADRLDPVTFPAGSGAGFRGKILAARKGGATLGHVVIQNVLGRSEQITLAVGVDPDGKVRRVEILSYRESHGGEVRMSAWRRQFEGKTVASPLKVGKDIAAISGATISCNNVTDGVKQIVALLDGARRQGLLK
jgi:Na+-translocating ferredoxin:NAD+ oxidoreductase RnfG subunit